jgi:hypothetical protein
MTEKTLIRAGRLKTCWAKPLGRAGPQATFYGR